MKKYNATHAARFIGCSRQHFYKLRDKYSLRILCVEGIVTFYGEKDLKKIRKAYNEA